VKESHGPRESRQANAKAVITDAAQTSNHPGQQSVTDGENHCCTIISPMRNTRIDRFLSHMAHVLAAKMTAGRLSKYSTTI
jgi:hypothetical protein